MEHKVSPSKLKPKIQGVTETWTAVVVIISLGFETKTPERLPQKCRGYFRRCNLSISFL